MQKLYNKLKKYSLKDAIFFEEKDGQFLALKKLYNYCKTRYSQETFLQEISDYLFLVIANSLVCYQLSGKGEDYWEEFGDSLEDKSFDNFGEIYNFFKEFLANSKNNKRFVETKLKRIKKLEIFYEDIQKAGSQKWKHYYKNMDKLAKDLAKIMNQKPYAKTIVFSVKMFSYFARNIFGQLEGFPENIMIPIDSRLENLYKKYNASKKEDMVESSDIKNFYTDLAKKLNIPLLHLDAILWVNYDELIK